MAPLLILILAIAGLMLGRQAAERKLDRRLGGEPVRGST
jgi:hypothetical protein